jgi:hypothetical protein
MLRGKCTSSLLLHNQSRSSALVVLKILISSPLPSHPTHHQHPSFSFFLSAPGQRRVLGFGFVEKRREEKKRKEQRERSKKDRWERSKKPGAIENERFYFLADF